MAKDPFAPGSTGELTKFDFAAEIRKAAASMPKGQAVPGIAGMLEQGLQGSRSGGGSSNGPMATVKMLIDQRKAQEKVGGGVTLPAGTPAWATVQAQLPGFAGLPHSQQMAAYNRYLAETTTALKRLNPEADDLDLQDALRTTNPAPLAPSRTTGQAITDNLRGLAAGAVGIVGSGAAAVDPASSAAAMATAAAQSLRGGMSAVEIDRQRQVEFEKTQLAADDEVGVIGKLLGEAGIELGNISSASLAELIGNIGPTLVGTAGVGLFARSLAKAGGASAASAARTGSRAAMGAGLATSAVLGGGDAAQGAYQSIVDMPLEELQQYPEWTQALEAAGGDEAAARRDVATSAARIAQAIGSTTGLVFALAPGSLERAVSGKIAGEVAKAGIGRAIGRRAGEAAVEGLDEAASTVAGNVGTGTLTGDLSAEALAAGAGGSFTLGALGGGVGGLATALVPGAEPPVVPTGDTTPGIDDLVGPDTAEPDAGLAPGTAFETGGINFVVQPDGSIGYAADQESSPIGDTIISAWQPPTAPTAGEAIGGAGAGIADAFYDGIWGRLTGTGGSSVVETEGFWPGVKAAYDAGKITSRDDVKQFLNPTPLPEFKAPDITPIPAAATPEGQAVASTFEQNVRTALGTENRQALAAANSVLAPLVNQLGALSDSNPVQSLFEATNLLAQLMRPGTALLTAVRTALRTTPAGEIGPLDGSPLGYLTRTLGMELPISRSNDPWATTVRTNSNGLRVLEAIAADPTTGLANQVAARELIAAFNAGGVVMPRVAYLPTLPKSVLAQYAPGTHEVRVSARSPANSVMHEMMHALTVRGLYALRDQVKAGDPQARGYLLLLAELRAQLRAAGGQRKYYGANANYQKSTNSPVGATAAELSEMFAEMLTPEFLALAAQTPVRNLSPEAQAVLDSLNAQPGDSILDALIRMIQGIIRLVAPGATISENSIASALARTAAESVRATPNRRKSATKITAPATTITPSFEVDENGEFILPPPPATTFDALRTGTAATVELWRGTGATAQQIYNGLEVPVAGTGTYYTSSEDQADLYGPNVTQETLEIQNPLVIASDADWRQLTNGAGWKFPNPAGLSETEVREMSEALKARVQRLGHDALVIRLANPRTQGDLTKTLGNVFGTDTVVDYTPSRARRDGVLRKESSDQTQTPAFQRWFGDSKVVDENGNPKVVYHGTAFDFDVFDGYEITGWFSESSALAADRYSVGRDNDGDSGPNVMPVYLSIQNPLRLDGLDMNDLLDAAAFNAVMQAAGVDFVLDGQGSSERVWEIVNNADFKQEASAAGYDGISVTEGGVPTWAAFKPTAIKSAIGNQGTFDPENDSILYNREEVEADALDEGADNIVGDNEPHNPRTSYADLVDGIERGEQAPGATDWRAFRQAAERDDAVGMRTAAANFGDKLNEHLHDHLSPVKRWIQRLPIPGRLRDLLMDALYTAPVRRDSLLRIGMEQHGGLKIQQALGRMVDKYGQPAETTSRWAGYWITASRAAAGNAKLIARDTKAVEAAQAEYTRAPTPENQAVVDAATAQLIARIRAVNNPNARVRTHAAGVAGFSNAQAAQLMATIESKLNRADLQALAETVYDLNSWKLALDIESGKTTPTIVAQFLERPDLLDMMQQLRDLALTADAGRDPNSVLALEAKRAEVMAAARTNYVPLTGRPDTALDADTFSVGSAAPNTAVDYRLEGRMTSIPDDALTATWASVLRSTNYAGWAPFQDAIAQAYNAMTPDQRREVGISHRVIQGGTGNARPGDNAIIRKRGNRVVAYDLADPKLLDAIRGSNVQDASHILPIVATPVKWYAYAATQLNLFFAPVNYFRDAWERSELIRKEGRYHDAQGNPVDGTKLGRALLDYTLNPTKAASLMNATGRFGFKMARRDTRAALMLEEMLGAGGVSVWGDRFTSDRAQFIKGIMRQRGLSAKLRPIAELIDAYNRTFDMAPALASYMALRDQGVPIDAAAAGALDLMNFRKRGASMGLFNALYAFAQPAVTGGANALGNLYDRNAGGFQRRGVTRLVTYTLAFAAIQAFARSLADDDEGGNKIDQVQDFTKNSNLLIPFGDGFVKIPLAFGLTRVANSAARNMLNAADGEISPYEAMGKFVSGGLVPVFSPIEDTNIDWTRRPTQAFMMTFAPSWLKPVVSVAVNRTANDAPVVFDNFEKTDEYRSEQFGKRIPEVYRDIAILLRKTLGYDFAPEEVKTLMTGYPMGSLSTLRQALVENPYNKAEGKPVNNPLLTRVYGVFSEGGKLSQFYGALEDTNEILRKQGAGDSLTEPERKELAWRAQWDKTDKELKSQRAKANRMTAGEAKERRQREISKQREQEQILAVYRYRQAIGKKATVVDVPSTLLAK